MNSFTSSLGSPMQLLDSLTLSMQLKNDSDLAKRLGLTPPVISKIRTGKTPVGPSFLINAHEESGLPISELKLIAGLPKAKPFNLAYCNGDPT